MTIKVAGAAMMVSGVQTTVQSVHCTVTVQCTLFTVVRTPLSVHYRIYTVHCQCALVCNYDSSLATRL